MSSRNTKNQNKNKNKIRNKNKNRTSNMYDNGPIPNRIYSTSFPQQTKVCLKYNHDAAFTATAGLPNDIKFRLNSIYDPDLSGSGHQPQGHDQWALLYNRYRVDSCSVVIRTQSISTHGNILCMLPNNSTATITDIYQFMESPLSRPIPVGTATAVTIAKHFDLKVLNGVSQVMYNTDDRFQSFFSASPTENLILHIGCWEIGSQGAVGMSYNVTLTYYITIFDPLTLASS